MLPLGVVAALLLSLLLLLVLLFEGGKVLLIRHSRLRATTIASFVELDGLDKAVTYILHLDI